jgi:predicted DNA-binding transcriptional regulator AlpA
MTKDPTVGCHGAEERCAESSFGPKRGLTEAEAAKYIGMSTHFLRLGRQDGRVGNRTPPPPHVKIGRAVRYLLDDLDKWLEERRHGAIKTVKHRCRHYDIATERTQPTRVGPKA